MEKKEKKNKKPIKLYTTEQTLKKVVEKNLPQKPCE